MRRREAPTRVRLRDGLTVLWRAPGEIQVGTDPRCGVVLSGLTGAEHGLLDLLPDAPSVEELLHAGRLSAVGPDRVRDLVATLARAGVLADERAGAHGRQPAPHRPDASRPGGSGPPPAPLRAADAAYWGRLRRDGDGWSVVTHRATGVVGVLGAGRLGMLVATGLAAAGVGTVLLADEDPVLAGDVVPGAFGLGHVGRRREDAGADVLRAAVPQVRTSAPPGTRPDLCVLVEHGVASPVRARPLLREDLAHLSVVVGDVDVVVGPLVVPGRGPCLRCLDLHRCDADERWPAVATQIAAQPRHDTESSLAPIAAALAVGEVLAHLDGRRPATRGATLEVDATDPVPRRRPWATHGECGCDAVAPAAPGPAPTRSAAAH